MTHGRRLLGAALATLAAAAAVQLAGAGGARAATAGPHDRRADGRGSVTTRPHPVTHPVTHRTRGTTRRHALRHARTVHDAAAPVLTDGRCVAGQPVAPTVTIPDDPGVRYSLDGVRVAAATVPVTPGAHRVRAASTRFRIPHGVFPLTATAATCPAPPGPVTAPVTGSRSAGRTRSDPVTSPARTVPRVAAAAPRATAPCTSDCLGPVAPRPAAFHDAGCSTSTGQPTGATYTVPSTRGVVYWVNGVDVAAGTYPARTGSTVTVVVSARAGYTLRGITQWTHTFADAPTCSTVATTAPKPATPSTGTGGGGTSGGGRAQGPAADPAHRPAYTGVDSAAMLVGSLVLVLLGAAACAAGSRRRATAPADHPADHPADGPARSGNVPSTRPVRPAGLLAAAARALADRPAPPAVRARSRPRVRARPSVP